MPPRAGGRPAETAVLLPSSFSAAVIVSRCAPAVCPPSGKTNVRRCAGEQPVSELRERRPPAPPERRRRRCEARETAPRAVNYYVRRRPLVGRSRNALLGSGVTCTPLPVRTNGVSAPIGAPINGVSAQDLAPRPMAFQRRLGRPINGVSARNQWCFSGGVHNPPTGAIGGLWAGRAWDQARRGGAFVGAIRGLVGISSSPPYGSE